MRQRQSLSSNTKIKTMKNIGILGLGAIGALITKYLIRNQANNYFYFSRCKKDKIKIKFQKELIDIRIGISSPADKKLDWLIVCLKEYHFQDAIPIIKELIRPDTKVAIFQNGLYLTKRYEQFSSPENLLETIIDCSIQRIESHPDTYEQFRNPKIILPENKIADQFIELFIDPSMEIHKSSSFIELQWIKLIESSSIGSIQAIYEMPCIVFQNAARLDEFKELVKEAIEVARSEGINVGDQLNNQLLTKLQSYSETKGSSMLNDKLAGNELELDAKIGIIVRTAGRNKIDVPTSKRIYNLLAN